MKKCLLMALACVLAMGLCLYAQDGGKAGTVQKVDVEGKKITVDFGPRPLTLTVTENTKIVQGEAAKTLADIKVGAKVTVQYHKDAAENRVADKITITG